jgi:hypothetical protein
MIPLAAFDLEAPAFAVCGFFSVFAVGGAIFLVCSN